jgi:phosphoglycolate phosphatase-like HAD superfamily hydrolase
MPPSDTTDLDHDALPSWRDTPTRTAITRFVEGVTGPGGVLPAERIAVFDNDGTLWSEKPVPIQADFLLRRLGEQVAADPSLAARQPWKAVAERDHAWFDAAITEHYEGDDTRLNTMAAGLLGAYEGTSIEEFEAIAGAFLREEKHPTLARAYVRMAFAPMVELLRYLEANGFTSYIATGGGRDFLRPVSQEVYGLPPERVIGSSVTLEYRDGRIVHTAALDVFDDGPAKPVRIWSRTGRRPLIAGGNANGDVPMLSWTAAAEPSGLALLVRHDDAEREFAYTAGADAALDEAAERGWTVVSVRDDWSRVFAD